MTQATQKVATAAAEAQTPLVRKKGPRVFLDMDQEELDDAYTQIKYAPNMPQILARFAANSAVTRARLGEPRRLAYGGAPNEQLDLYAAPVANAPVCVFVHGGAWRQGEARNVAFPAEMFVGAGAHFAALDFDNVVTTGGDLMPIADQVRRAVAWVYANASSFGGDPRRLYVCGHSSGGHLAGVILTTDWARDFGLPADSVRGGLVISGMYDLEPVRLSARSDYIRFTDAMVEALSPQSPRRSAELPDYGRARDLGDARISPPGPRLRRRREVGRQGGRATCRRRAITISRYWRRSPILTACSGARRSE